MFVIMHGMDICGECNTEEEALCVIEQLCACSNVPYRLISCSRIDVPQLVGYMSSGIVVVIQYRTLYVDDFLILTRC